MVVVAQDPISGGKWIVIVWINVIKDDLKNVGKVNDPFRTYFTHSAADGCYLLPVASFKLLFRVQALNRVLNAAFFNVATMRREEDGKRTLAEWRGPPKWKIKKNLCSNFLREGDDADAASCSTSFWTPDWAHQNRSKLEAILSL